jgi:hypothetical protein
MGATLQDTHLTTGTAPLPTPLLPHFHIAQLGSSCLDSGTMIRRLWEMEICGRELGNLSAQRIPPCCRIVDSENSQFLNPHPSECLGHRVSDRDLIPTNTHTSSSRCATQLSRLVGMHKASAGTARHLLRCGVVPAPLNSPTAFHIGASVTRPAYHWPAANHGPQGRRRSFARISAWHTLVLAAVRHALHRRVTDVHAIRQAGRQAVIRDLFGRWEICILLCNDTFLSGSWGNLQWP